MIEVFINKTVEVVEVVVQNNQNIDCNITNNQSIIDVVVSELGSKGDTGNQGIKGDKGDTGNQGEDGNTNVFIQQTEPGLATPYIWYQTDATGSLVSIWINKV